MTEKKSTEPRYRHTRELWDALVKEYGERPAQHSWVSRAVGCSRNMARGAWFRGWVGISWAKPIQSILAAEQDEADRLAARQAQLREDARMRREAAEDAERERARNERIRELAEEVEIRGALRKGVRQAAATVLALSPAIAQMVQVVSKAVFDMTPGPDGKPVLTPKANADVSPRIAMEIISRWGTLAGKVALASDVTVHLGMDTRGPEERQGAPEMSLEEANEAIRHFQQIAATMDLPVVLPEPENPGGNNPPPTTH